MERVKRLSKRVKLVPRFFSAVVVVLIVELVIHVLNPFGIDEVIEARAARIIQIVGSPWYGGLHGESTRGQNFVTVVMINHRFAEQAAKAPGGPAVAGEAVWPLPVSTLMLRVVKPILRARPAALFIDLSLPYAPRESAPGGAADTGQTIQALADHLSDIDHDPSGVPVFLSDVIEANDDEKAERGGCPKDYVPGEDIAKSGMLARAIRQRLFKDERPGKLAMVDSAVLTPEGAYQLAPAASGRAGNCHDQARKNAGYIPSPALALFAALCPNPSRIDLRKKISDLCGQSTISRLSRSIKIVQYRTSSGFITDRDTNGLRLYSLGGPAVEPMELRWGVNFTHTMMDAYAETINRDKCFSQFNPSPIEPLILLLKMAVRPVHRYFERSMEHRCVYIDTIAPDDLDARFQSSTRLNGTEPRGGVEHNFAHDFIRDRIVLLGVDLTQAGDSYESPVNGNIPGVYVHAAAIENLLTRGANFSRSKASGTWLLLLIFVDAVAYVFIRWLWEQIFHRIGAERSVLMEFLVAPLIYFVIIIVFGAIFVGLLAQTSVPLADIALPIVALHLLLIGKLAERFEERLKARFIGSRAAASTGVPAHPGAPAMEVGMPESVEVTVRETWTLQASRPLRSDEEGAEP